jgi:integrase
MDLLRWFRFLWALGMEWDQATRVEARDFCRWLQVSVKPTPHWRRPDDDSRGSGRKRTTPRVNAVTGKAFRGDRYEATTVAHCESVVRGFYDFHLEAGTGPMVNPFPLSRHRGAGRADAHHNPMEPFDGHRSGRYRPKLVTRAPRCIPDERFDELIAQLGSHRDRALVAFWVSTGARASELLGATVADVDPGQQLITVVRKGTRALQPLPAAPDAFVWLRLYQGQLAGLVPSGRDEPLWWTLRRSFRALRYDAARVMFTRANAALGSRASRVEEPIRVMAFQPAGMEPSVSSLTGEETRGLFCSSAPAEDGRLLISRRIGSSMGRAGGRRASAFPFSRSWWLGAASDAGLPTHEQQVDSKVSEGFEARNRPLEPQNPGGGEVPVALDREVVVALELDHLESAITELPPNGRV